MKALVVVLEFLSAGSAIVAAVLWWRASADRTAELVLQGIKARGGPQFFGGDFTELTQALTVQGKLNSRAAIAAAIAAAFQGLAIFIGLAGGL